MNFASIEPQVNDLANLAQINGRIFEELTAVGDGKHPNYVLNYQTYAMLSFLVGELCGRTIKLEKDFEAALSELGKAGTK